MLYTPGEICKKLDGVNSRTIADMAEKGLIVPVKDSDGGGTSRLYDKEGVFKIVLLSAMRGTFSLKTQANFLHRILKETSLSEDRIAGHDVPIDEIETGYFDATGKDVSRDPKSYVKHTINVSAIRKFVDKNF
jgi:DNA-binding transcriptional MerR regulator